MADFQNFGIFWEIREIFANLSDGDGFLQLENPNSPLKGGLTLVAHPKWKNVRRLASMSGGEKSLTALSFLFALQKYLQLSITNFINTSLYCICKMKIMCFVIRNCANNSNNYLQWNYIIFI